MRVVISGASGLIGAALARASRQAGDQVTRLVRGPSGDAGDGIHWQPAAGTIDSALLEEQEGVVHLAGESIAGGRWSRERKASILSSRVEGTRLLSETLARLAHPPAVLACASAIGYYGNRGDEPLTETSPAGEGFLPRVCREWEKAAEPARARGIRVVHLRFGVVLSPVAGALEAMLRPFRLGLGGRVGSGRQYMSWIHLQDAVDAVRHALASRTLTGAVNIVSPEPVTNAEFAGTLARVLSRPALLPLPATMARLALGEMADALLLASTRVVPARLSETGFTFRFPALEGALRNLLARRKTA
jgi:uncharacterized protein (TIGR01777 family)